MHEYAFDIKLWAVARINAANEDEARKRLADINCIDVGYDEDGIKITEASLEENEDSHCELFEVDGETPVEED